MFTRFAFGRDRGALFGLLAAVLLTGVARAAPEEGDATARESTSKHYAAGGREARAPTSVSRDRYEALVTSGTRAKPGAAQAKSAGSGKLSGQAMESVANDFWIFFADVVLFGDDDRDGFSYGIDLLFDADTIYEAADVYAVLYLSLEGGPWNEYAVTEDFTIFGATSEDEFVVVTELEAGFPRGSYDILIELYDAFDGTFLASLGPADTSELGFLPLEDFERDDPRDDHHHHHDGGGAAGLPLLAFLLLFAANRLRRLAGEHTARDPLGRGTTAGEGNVTVARTTLSYRAGSGVAPRAVRMTLRAQAESESKQA